LCCFPKKLHRQKLKMQKKLKLKKIMLQMTKLTQMLTLQRLRQSTHQPKLTSLPLLRR